MIEPCLRSIIDAGDPSDPDDVAIRKLLVTALSSSGIEMAQIMNGRIPPIPQSIGRCHDLPPRRGH